MNARVDNGGEAPQASEARRRGTRRNGNGDRGPEKLNRVPRGDTRDAGDEKPMYADIRTE